MKLYAGGPLDLRDAEQAIKISPDALDLQLLKALCTRFGRDVASKLDSLLAELSSDRGKQIEQCKVKPVADVVKRLRRQKVSTDAL